MAGAAAKLATRSTVKASGDRRSRVAAGSGINWHATASRQASSDQSSSQPGPRPIDGRVVTSISATPAHSGTVVQRYAPANATSAQPIRRRRGKAATETSERGFGVVVLVLMAVVPRVVVLVLREVDLVQHDGGVAGP